MTVRQSSPPFAVSRARDNAELVTDDKAAPKEQLKSATGERIAALEAVEPDKAKGREAGASPSRDRDRAAEPAMERSRASKGLDRDVGL